MPECTCQYVEGYLPFTLRVPMSLGSSWVDPGGKMKT
jgi:hypothetical protein